MADIQVPSIEQFRQAFTGAGGVGPAITKGVEGFTEGQAIGEAVAAQRTIETQAADDFKLRQNAFQQKIKEFEAGTVTPEEIGAPVSAPGRRLTPSAAKLLQPTPPDGEAFAKSEKLRNEFAKQSKEFFQVTQSFQRVMDSASDPSAAGDLALIFNFMKTLDPGSVVRESEFATAQNAAGVPERIRAKYNNILEGERLSDKTRQDFVTRSIKIFTGQQKLQGGRVSEFSRLAKRAGLAPEDVIFRLPVDVPETGQVAPVPPTAPPAGAPNKDLFNAAGIGG